MMWYLLEVLIYISLMAEMLKSFHVFFLPFIVFGEMFIQVLCPFLTISFEFNVLCILDINPSSNLWCASIFSLS